MAVIRGSKRVKPGAKRFDPSRLRDVLKDDRLWVVAATVVKPEDTTSHFELVQEGGKIVDVLVEVECSPEHIELTCRLGTLGGGAMGGLWAVPKVGTEVLVALPSGRMDHMPCIVAVLSTGDIPDRLTETRVVLVADTEIEVEAPSIRLGKEATEAVIKGDAFKAIYDTHTHPSGMGPTGPPAALPASTLSEKVKVG